MKENLILFGFPCCGKTSAGEQTARQLRCPFIDTDRVMERAFGKNCHEIARLFGLPFFRAEEEKIVATLKSSPPSIIALGGGAILVEKNHAHLKKIGRLVYLSAPFPVLAQRNLARTPVPTYIDPNDPYGSLLKLYESREKRYQELANEVLDTTDLSIEEIANRLSQKDHYGK